MRKPIYLILLTVASWGLASPQLAVAQRTPVFQPIGTENEDTPAVSLVEPLHLVLPEA